MSSNNKNNKYSLLVFMPIVVALVIQNAVQIVLMEICFVRNMATYQGGSYESFMGKYIDDCISPSSLQITYIGYSIVTLAIFGYLYWKMRKNEGALKSPFKNISSNVAIMVLGILVLTVAMFFVVTFVMNAIGAMFPAWLEEYEAIVEQSGLADDLSPLLILYALFMGPIVEELAFRGLTFKYARSFMRPWTAIIMQAVLFGAFHQNMYQAVYATIIGVVLGYVMLKYDNLLIVIIMHILFNSISSFDTGITIAGSDTFLGFFLELLLTLLISYGGILLIKKAAPAINKNEIPSDN